MTWMVSHHSYSNSKPSSCGWWNRSAWHHILRHFTAHKTSGYLPWLEATKDARRQLLLQLLHCCASWFHPCCTSVCILELWDSWGFWFEVWEQGLTYLLTTKNGSFAIYIYIYMAILGIPGCWLQHVDIPSDEAGGPIDAETPGDSWLDHRVKCSNFDSWLVVWNHGILRLSIYWE